MSMRKRKKVQILSREELMLRRWDFRLVPSERSLEAVGESVRLHIISRSKVFDLFPRTYKGKNRCVSRRKHALINSRERPLKSDINLEQSSHVETVVLMSGRKNKSIKSVENKGFPGVGNCRLVVPAPGFFSLHSSVGTGLWRKLA